MAKKRKKVQITLKQGNELIKSQGDYNQRIAKVQAQGIKPGMATTYITKSDMKQIDKDKGISIRKQKAKSIRKEGRREMINAAWKGMKLPAEAAFNGAKAAIKASKLGDKETMIGAAVRSIASSNVPEKSWKLQGEYYKGMKKALFNDLSWYNNYPESTQEMIGPNFNARLGTQDDLLDLNSNTTAKPTMPSFASIMVKLTRGDDSDQAVTAAINRIFTTIRQANSGSVNWSPYQLDAYIYNYRRVIALYSCLLRGLKYLNKYSVVDNNIPYALFASLGFTYEDFKTNGASLRNQLLSVRTRMTSYAIPKFDILNRTYWLFSHGYSDSDDIKHQTYHFVPIIKEYYQMANNALASMSPSFDPSISMSEEGVSISSATRVLDKLCEEFYTNQVYSIISGDIVKAYGVGSLFILDKLPDVGELPQVGYSEEVLAQIQNLYVPRTGQGSNLQLTLTHSSTDDVGLTETVTYIETGYANIPNIAKTQTYVNSYKNGITNLDVLGMTRLIGLSTNDSSSFTLATYGTEIVERVRYYIIDINYNSNLHKVRPIDTHNLMGRDMTTVANVEVYSLPAFCWATFDWSPRMVELINYYTSGSTTLSVGVGATLFDFNNYSKIDSIAMLRAIHNVALQSLYYTPLLSKVSTNVVELPDNL